jgi:hypothetical protein
MKQKVLLLACFILMSAALSQAQDKATLSSFRILPKPGKDAAIKKAIADHAAKFHTGSWKWRVFSVLSGPDEGGYMINEGPNSWTELEGRKEISAEHTRDYETNILPLVEKTLPASYLTYQRELSTDSAVGPLKKALLRHYYVKPGKAGRLRSYMTTWKKVWEKVGQKTVVWTSFFSGEPQMVVAFRLPQGWIDLEQPMGKKMREGFDEVAGDGAYVRYLEDLDQYVDRIVEEMIELLPELGSK